MVFFARITIEKMIYEWKSHRTKEGALIFFTLYETYRSLATRVR